MNASTRRRIAIRVDLIRRVKDDLIGRLSLPYRPDDLHEDVRNLAFLRNLVTMHAESTTKE